MKDEPIPSLQDIVSDWSERNDMCINTQKTKEMVVCFCKDEDNQSNMPKLAINGAITEHVSHAKVLGVTLSANLCWIMHVENSMYKASKRLYMLY